MSKYEPEKTTCTYPVLFAGFTRTDNGVRYLEILYRKENGSTGYAKLCLLDELDKLVFSDKAEIEIEETKTMPLFGTKPKVVRTLVSVSLLPMFHPSHAGA